MPLVFMVYRLQDCPNEQPHAYCEDEQDWAGDYGIYDHVHAFLLPPGRGLRVNFKSKTDYHKPEWRVKIFFHIDYELFSLTII